MAQLDELARRQEQLANNMRNQQQLTEAQQIAILETLDGAQDEDLEPGADFFRLVKKMTVDGYYTSKIGIDELNKNGVPSTFACTHDSHA